MTCEEYRELWLSHSPRADNRAGDRDSASQGHGATCAACQTWMWREQALDDLFQPAFLVAPPSALAERLAELPSQVFAPAPAPVRFWSNAGLIGSLLEVAFLVVIGLGLTGLASNLAQLPSALLDLSGNVLQAMPLIFNGPLLDYAQSVGITLTEVLATVLIVALGLLQVRGPSVLE